MKDLQRSGLTREQWSAMTLYEKFEQVVIFVLSVIIAAIVVASVWAQGIRCKGIRTRSTALGS